MSTVNDFPIINMGGEDRVLACLPRTVEHGGLPCAPKLEETIKLIPRSEWWFATPEQIAEAIASPVPILDQNGEGACAAGGTCGVTMRCSYGQNLGNPVRLAMGRLYHYSGNGRDQGSALSDNLRYAMELGIPPVIGSNELDYRSSWTAEEKTEAAKHKIIEAFDCPSFDHLMTALQVGGGERMCVLYGIMVGSRFDCSVSDMWVPSQRGNGGHGLCGILPCRAADGTLGILTANTWSRQWGANGFGIVPESYFSGSFNDGWAARLVVEPS
jgi:hypothetical protein